jgi:hypothetical protein
MAWGRVLVAAVAAPLATAVPARAGTYQVSACAGGANAAWVPFSSSANAFDVTGGCPMRALSDPAPNRRAGYFEAGWWRLTAPPGTGIDRLRITRYGQRFSQGDGESTGGVPQGGWVSEGYTEDGTIQHGFAREGCTIQPNNFGCEWGSQTTPVDLDLDAKQVTYQVACIVGSGCDTSNNAGVPFAEVTIDNAIATIRDDVAPELSIGGPLLAGGWRRPTDGLAIAAKDVTGIGTVEAVAGAVRGTADTPCDYTRMVPCGPVERQLQLEGLADGTQTLTVTARDAAGNPTSATRTISVDGTPPSAVLQPPSHRRLVVKVGDELSGVAGGQILVAGTPLATRLWHGRLTAKLEHGNPRRADVTVTVSDTAGNVTSGMPPRLQVPHKRRLRFGHRARLRGRVTTPTGEPLAHVPVQATTTVRRRGATARPIAGTTTSKHGRFRLTIPRGPSRTLRVIVPPTDATLRAARGVGLRVAASSTIHANRHVVGPGTVVRFSGRVRRAGQRLPKRGLLVALQGRSAGAWRTFADTRTTRQGRWHARYRFRGIPGRYPVRLRIRRQGGFPFDLGYSRATTVRVR